MASNHIDAEVSHPGLLCYGCRQNIHGVRYKCFVCPDYYLCSACEKRGFHYEHDLIEIPVARPVIFNPQPEPGKAQSSQQATISCQSCGVIIRGIRYKCVTCPDCDLCPDCERDFHKEHSIECITPVQDKGILHPGVFCDGCGINIHGIRFKCRSCPDLNLCSDCEGQGFHKEHSMVKMSRPIKKTKKTKGRIHKGVRCDSCSQNISGVRYKCSVCPSYNLCSKCESKGHHKKHGMIQISKPDDNVEDLQGRCHPGITCNGCKHNISGVRFKCRICLDIDMCIICEDMGLHKEHSKVKISSPLPSTQTSLANTPDSDLHPGVICDRCRVNIRGPRFKCRFCPNYDLCVSCHNKGIHVEHTKIRIERHWRPSRESPCNSSGHPIVESNAMDAKLPSAPPVQDDIQSLNVQAESREVRERKNSDNEDRMTCDICMERKKESFIIPCGHTLCTECAVAMNNSENKQCPFCRKDIQGIGKIFF